MVEKTHIDIQQRSFDQHYVVWERMWPWLAGDQTELSADLQFHPDKGDESYWEFVHKYIMVRLTGHAWHKKWVPVMVCDKKSEAVDYCRRRVGRHCFKDNDKVTVAFT